MVYQAYSLQITIWEAWYVSIVTQFGAVFARPVIRLSIMLYICCESQKFQLKSSIGIVCPSLITLPYSEIWYVAHLYNTQTADRHLA